MKIPVHVWWNTDASRIGGPGWDAAWVWEGLAKHYHYSATYTKDQILASIKEDLLKATHTSRDTALDEIVELDIQ